MSLRWISVCYAEEAHAMRYPQLYCEAQRKYDGNVVHEEQRPFSAEIVFWHEDKVVDVKHNNQCCLCYAEEQVSCDIEITCSS